ncbi:uncharacterized protein LOC121926610 [Sceloporus undulatus]|uniref:uncharacterized protein LOC121926610 n=1 Tax=Sceloporus undulatus TaxID=8520 RepID=UPI001C4BC96A|nr:uncharacterized protein LOC121926610 [Sceloporus undulatus]
MEFRGKRYERGSNWSEAEVWALLGLWADAAVQAELESCLRNQHVFNRIAEVLRGKGVHRTGDQCREKIKKMKLEYRRVKDNPKAAPRGAGAGARAWKFYGAMDRVLSGRQPLAHNGGGGALPAGPLPPPPQRPSGPPASASLAFQAPQSPVQLMEIKCEEVEEEEEGEQGLRPQPPFPPPPPGDSAEEEQEAERSQEGSPASRGEAPLDTSVSPSGFSEPNMASSSRIQSLGPRPGFSTLHYLRKKRKAQRLRDPLDALLLKTLTAQREMEERFLQMEERRLQRDLEVEERRMQLEQRRFELERDHEFRMFNVFAQMLSILKQSNTGSSASGQPQGMELNQTFSESPGAGERVQEEGQTSQLGRPTLDRTTSVYSFYNHNDFQSSPYLSVRGSIASICWGSTEEGYNAYHADKYDEDKNPNGIINFGTSENKLCFDLMSKRLTQSDMNVMEPPWLQYPDWKGHMFLREEVARFLTYYCKAPAPLKAENVIVQNGCGSLFSSLATVLCDPGEAFLIPSPFYGGITQSVFLYGNVKLVYVYLDSQITGTHTRPPFHTVDKLRKALQDAHQRGVRSTRSTENPCMWELLRNRYLALKCNGPVTDSLCVGTALPSHDKTDAMTTGCVGKPPGMQRIREVLEECEHEILIENKAQSCQSDSEGKADSTDEVIFVSHRQEPVSSGSATLGDLIGLLQQQMRSSDWLQKNTVEQFAEEKPEVYDVFSKLVGKQ